MKFKIFGIRKPKTISSTGLSVEDKVIPMNAEFFPICNALVQNQQDSVIEILDNSLIISIVVFSFIVMLVYFLKKKYQKHNKEFLIKLNYFVKILLFYRLICSLNNCLLNILKRFMNFLCKKISQVLYFSRKRLPILDLLR